jgi:GNAT superfamily N-acetyltransferase
MPQEPMHFEIIQGPAIEPHIDDLARLRISVFRDFPYLYDGSPEYEARYLSTYARSPDSVFVLAFDGDQVVGASTGMPMSEETEEVKTPFLAHGWDPEQIFYFGESVLLPAYRGRGVGVRFFEEREKHARNLGRFRWCTFCAVERPADHPRRPADYVPLNNFWRRRGFQHHPELHTTFSWRDLDEETESAKPMSFWIKELT